MAHPKNQFSTAFRRVRMARGMTQEDFSDTTGRTYISELERDVKRPTLAKIDELSASLEVHPLAVLALSYAPSHSLAAVDKLLAQVRKDVEGILEEK